LESAHDCPNMFPLPSSCQALHGRSLYDQGTGQAFHAPLPRDLLDFLQNQLSLSYEAIQERILSEDFCFLANEPKN